MSDKHSPAGSGGSSETDIISRYFAPLAQDASEALGLIDDAALISPDGATDLVLTADGLVAGAHFVEDSNPQDIAFKALAVNVSDLVAKGAEPYLYLLTLALPNADSTWLGEFAQGLSDAQSSFGCRLAGGDTVATSGPLTLSITAIGRLPAGEMVKRSGGVAGDVVYVSGSIGDAALGLALTQDVSLAAAWQLDEAQSEFLTACYRRPAPPLELAPVLRRCAHAAMDVSDGLIGDFDALCRASGTGGELALAQVPLSKAAERALQHDLSASERIMTGGDDYQVLAAVPPAQCNAFETESCDAAIAVTRIGVLSEQSAGIRARDASGIEISFERPKFDHFR
jgi:thiamine-monophosphate kinase